MNYKTIAILGIFLLFIILQIQIFTPVMSDENNYFYLASEVVEGKVPFKDFFFAHVPLQLYVLAIPFLLFGYNFIVIKSIALIATGITVLFLFLTLKHEYGATTGLFGAVSYLFIGTTFYFGGVNMGINLTVMWLVIGLYLMIRQKYVLSGLFYAISAMTGTYALFAIGIIFLFYIKKPKLYLSFAVFFGLINLSFWLMAGNVFIYQAYLYHFMKPAISSSSKISILVRLFFQDYLILVPFIISVWLLKNKFLYISVIAGTALILLQNPQPYYYMIIYPIMIIGFGQLFRNRIMRLAFCGLLAISTFNIANNIEGWKNMYEFHELEELKGVIGKGDGMIFGDFDITQLTALELDRKVLIDSNVDTYPMAVHVLDIDKMIQSVYEAELDYLIVHEIGGGVNPIWRINDMKNVLKEKCNYGDAVWSKKSGIGGIKVYECGG